MRVERGDSAIQHREVTAYCSQMPSRMKARGAGNGESVMPSLKRTKPCEKTIKRFVTFVPTRKMLFVEL